MQYGDNMKDKNGQSIELLSKVAAKISDGLFDSLDPTLGNSTEVLAIVDELLPENKVKCVPISKGMPFIIDSDRVEVVEPLIARLMAAVTDDEVTKILEEAQARLTTVTVDVKVRAKKEGGKGSVKNAKINLAEGMVLE
jgi:uncharacterized protein with PIN domain